MGSLRASATAGGFLALALAGLSTAEAADLLPPPVMPEVHQQEIGGNWYLRGDVGVSRYEGGKFSSAAAPNATFFGEDFGSGAFAGAGIGYQFSRWFRADVTGEYRFSTGFKVNDRDAFSDAFGNNIISHEKSKGGYSAAVFLANGYFDLGTWYGITPFVGAGVGYAFNRLSGWETETANIYANPTFPVGVSGGTIRDRNKGDFAWALHAGLAYDVASNLKLELAYRYLNLGSVQTGVIDCYCGQPLQGLKAKNLESHDIKLGMRWVLDSPAPVLGPAPLIRKY